MRTRAWKIEDGWAGSSRPPAVAKLLRRTGCDDRSAQRADPTHKHAARRGLGAVPRLGRRTRCFCFLIAAVSFGAIAQPFEIKWSTIDGGGGTSTGGVYAVSGTIGQPDASQQIMTGGDYSLTGGFWALYAVQTPGAPVLTILPAGPGQAAVSWSPATGTNWVLQESLSLSPVNWTNSPSGSTNSIIVPATLPTKFYRLFKP